MKFHFNSSLWRGTFFSLIFGIIIFLFGYSLEAASFDSMTLPKDKSEIIEVIRLSVPPEGRKAWLSAEKRSWEPWLEKQNGCIERQLYWDKTNVEGLLLISWTSRKKWKSIPKSEIDTVQDDFERLAREEMGQSLGNPFPLLFEGELIPQ